MGHGHFRLASLKVYQALCSSLFCLHNTCPTESGHSKRHTSLVFLWVLLDKGLDQTGGRGDHSQVLVIQEVDDPGGPLPDLDVLGRGAQQSQQGQGSTLLHRVNRFTTKTQNSTGDKFS